MIGQPNQKIFFFPHARVGATGTILTRALANFYSLSSHQHPPEREHTTPDRLRGGAVPVSDLATGHSLSLFFLLSNISFFHPSPTSSRLVISISLYERLKVPAYESYSYHLKLGGALCGNGRLLLYNCILAENLSALTQRHMVVRNLCWAHALDSIGSALGTELRVSPTFFRHTPGGGYFSLYKHGGPGSILSTNQPTRTPFSPILDPTSYGA